VLDLDIAEHGKLPKSERLLLQLSYFVSD
jgi:hypothetical protein